MSAYDDDEDYDRHRSRHDRPPPPPSYPSMDYDDQYGRNGGYPAPQQASNVPPPPMGDQLNRSSLKREGSRSRVPNLRPEFPDEQSYLGSGAHDLEGKNRRRHREFRDMRDGYESDEGEVHRKAKAGGRDDRRRRDERPPPVAYDDRDSRRGDDDRRRRRDREREYEDEDPPPRRRDRDRDGDRDRRRRDRDRDRDDPGVQYGADPIPMKRSRSERQPYRPKKPTRDDYDEDIFSSSDDDRRRDRRRGKSTDDGRRRRRRDDDYDDDRSDRSRRPDDRDRRRRDKSRRRGYSDEESEYDDRDRDRRRRKDKDRRRDESPKEMRIGGFDVGPLLQGGQKHLGTLVPLLAPLAMNMAKKKFGNK